MVAYSTFLVVYMGKGVHWRSASVLQEIGAIAQGLIKVLAYGALMGVHRDEFPTHPARRETLRARATTPAR